MNNIIEDWPQGNYPSTVQETYNTASEGYSEANVVIANKWTENDDANRGEPML